MAQLSLQTFTIRKFLKHEKDMMTIISKLKDLGIHTLEAARIDFDLKTARAFINICQKYDMRIGSSQIKFHTINENFDEIVEIHKLWDCKYIAVSVLPMKYLLKKEQGLKEFANELNKLGERLSLHNLQLLFHHHHFEFIKYGDKLGLELLIENTDPKYVGFVLDTYWIQRGGKTPQELIERYKGRAKVVHLRDYKIRFSKFDLLPSDCEIGNGNLDFKKIIDSSIANGVVYMAIEQNSKEPIESIRKSVENIKQMGFEKLFAKEAQ